MEIHTGTFLFYIAAVFTASVLVQLFYYFFFYSRIIFYRGKNPDFHTEPVSVIICAKNESENLKRYLPLILEQDYPEFEVIVVDDRSTDDSPEVLRKFIDNFPNLRISTINRDPILTYGKKLAQTIGIKAAKNELLLFTDADCMIESRKWLYSMVQNFRGNTEVVLGYGGYQRQKGFLDKFIRYETLRIALQYLAFALAGFPYMGVGRNLAYRKSTFFRNKGFASHAQLSSGDDDLFVNEVANKYNTKTEISRESHTRSVPQTTFGKWLNQKSRHITTGKRYRPVHIFLIGTELLSRVLMYASFTVLISFLFYTEYICGAFCAYILIYVIILKLTMKRLNEKKLLLYSLIFEITIPFIYSGLAISNYINRKRSRWR